MSLSSVRLLLSHERGVHGLDIIFSTIVNSRAEQAASQIRNSQKGRKLVPFTVLWSTVYVRYPQCL